MRLRVKRLHPSAQIPLHATAGSACFDLRALVREDPVGPDFSVTIKPGDSMAIRTGLAFEIPRGYAMLVFSRSGHGFNNGIRLANCVGVIDSDYRGEVMVKLCCDAHGDALDVRHGDRVAQAMLVNVPWFSLDEAEELSGTERGTGGFGSTGA